MRRSFSTTTITPPPLSAELCPAKTWHPAPGVTALGRSVLAHCLIVGHTARALVQRFPAPLQEALFPPGFALLAASHDVGKVSPTFACKLMKAVPGALDSQPALASVLFEQEKNWGGHAGASQLALNALATPPHCAEIAGMHHGFIPSVALLTANAPVLGGEPWQQARAALVQQLQAEFGADWPQIDSYASERLLAGLTTVADWIGSGEHFEDPSRPWQGTLDSTLDTLGFGNPQLKQGLSFEQMFGFTPRPAQQQLIDQASQPGVYILEAPMGLGKTEAALYAAWQLMASQQARGIYFALPTQLTSNRIHQRFNDFLDRILTDDSPHRARLLHSNAWLFESDLGEEGRPGNSWFDSAKRGLLAPFAVGTIDQALMAAMHVRHGFVRAFGLAGKVVILDEVHSYDSYTGTILDTLIATLRQLHCTVIILSATLSAERRQQLLGEHATTDAESSQAYPLISAQPGTDAAAPVMPHTVEMPKNSSASVALQLQPDAERAVDEALQRAAEGQQVLWIENTVADAQQRYLQLAANAAMDGVECGLLHSRFTRADRETNEDRWVDLYGKAGQGQRKGRILVGTQVLEQSLDIDADFLVSRFAPTDMLLQRLGRLWRHAETPRPAEARREAWLLAPALDAAIANPKQAFAKSASVYSPYVLCRSLEAWHTLQQVTLPDDIRTLIDQTYQSREEQGEMARWLHDLQEGNRFRIGQRALTQLAGLTLAKQGQPLPDEQLQTRYSEQDNCETLLLQSLRLCPDEQCSRLVLLDGSELTIPWHCSALPYRDWRTLAARLMRQQLPVNARQAPQPLSKSTLERTGLGNCCYLGGRDATEATLRLALVQPCENLRGYQDAPLNDKFQLAYSADLGYLAQPIRE